MINWNQTVISQFTNSVAMLQLISMFNEWVDPKADFDAFYRNVWNIDSATGYGLDVWGRIVGISRVVQIPDTNKNFGFKTSDNSFVGFNSGGVFRNGFNTLENYSLSDDAFRTYIYFKAAANISNCSATNINKLFSYLFADRGRVFVQKTGTMQITYVFQFILTTYELAILQSTDAAIRGTGVLVSINQNPPSGYFGFNEMQAGALPFNQGVFRTT